MADCPAVALLVGRFGLTSDDSDARWQAAVALAEVKTQEAVSLLRQYTADTHEYVRRRAHLAIRSVDTGFAEHQALKWLESPHEYSRMVALGTLADLGSSHLRAALERLRDDDSAVVQGKVRELVRSRPDV